MILCMNAERLGHGWKSIKLKTKRMTKGELTVRVCEIFDDLYGMEDLENFPDMNFVEVLVLDSIDFLELMRRIEINFDVEIDYNDYANARTLNQLVNRLYDTITKKAT